MRREELGGEPADGCYQTTHPVPLTDSLGFRRERRESSDGWVKDIRC